ncbi:vesicular glutamate transporter 3-like isoform X2 [Branchiostoma lanceolatum]|uniref:vesicular glutamate transporter 3-like isoform X2 n=1 Tax=Branchiostoma lanceolatum TaxID=7740 RepID=UPI003456CE54
MTEVNSMETITTSSKLLCVLLFTGILLQYAGRSSISVVLVELQKPPGNNTLTNVSKSQVQYSQFQAGVILSSVYIGMLPSSLIGGYLAYRFSAIRVFLASIGISSIVHGGGAVMFDDFETAVTQRILAGMAEGLSEPATFGVLNQYLSPEQSARVSPFIFAGGLGITCAAVSVVFAVAGMAKKRDALDRNKGDIKKMKSIPVFRIFTSTAVWASILLQAAPYFWDPSILPLYFSQSFGTKTELVGVLAGIPILIFGVLEPLFALVENTLCKHVSTTAARKSMAVIACLCVSGCLFMAAFTSNPVVAACFIATAYGSHAARAAVGDANIFDIAPRYASVISGICRAICRVVGLTFPLLVTAITKNKSSQEWSRVVLIKACVLAATALFFGAFGSGEEQPWAVEVPQGQSGGTQPGSRKDHKVDDENRPLFKK